MERFKFQLETVLNHRKRIEEARSGELAAATHARLQAEASVREIDEQEAESFRRQAEIQASSAFTVMDLEGFDRFRHGLGVQRELLLKAVDKARRDEEAARRRLVEARKAREILDRLKDQQFQAWLAELDAAEARLMDELATQAYARPKALDAAPEHFGQQVDRKPEE